MQNTKQDAVLGVPVSVSDTLTAVQECLHKAEKLQKKGETAKAAELTDNAETILSALVIVLRSKISMLPAACRPALEYVQREGKVA